MSHHSMSGVSKSGGGGKCTYARVESARELTGDAGVGEHDGRSTYAVHNSSTGGERHLVRIDRLVHP